MWAIMHFNKEGECLKLDKGIKQKNSWERKAGIKTMKGNALPKGPFLV
jgi:hypothetical protein